MNKSKKKIFLRVPKIFLKAKDPVFPGIFHKSEELIDEPQIRYRTLSDSGRALIWTSGVDKKRDYFNKPWLDFTGRTMDCLLYTSPSPRDRTRSRMPSSA